MLYDPKWQWKTKVDPLDLKTLIAWLETKDPKKRYCYANISGRCLFSQYLTHFGYPREPDLITDRSWFKLHKLYGDVAVEGAQTFGAALERAKALMARPHR